MSLKRTWISVSSGSIAFLLNSALSYLIFCTRVNTLGKYKHLLFLYTLSASIYASNQEFVVCPSGYLLYDTLNVLPKSVAIVVIENYAICFIVLITIISWCFVYRYFVMLRTSSLSSLHRKWKQLLASTVTVVAFVLFFSLYSCFPRESYYLENKDPFHRLTGRELSETAFNCGPIEVEGEVNWQVYFGLSQFAGFISFCALVNIFCSYRILVFLRKSFSESNTALKRQTRVFTLLMLQFLFPLCFNMTPVFLVFLAAYFRLPTFNLEIYVGPIVSLAQIIDPLLIFFFIPDYRRSLRNYFRRTIIHPEVFITYTVYA